MRCVVSVSVLFFAVAAFCDDSGTCGTQQPPKTDCDHPDLGSCGLELNVCVMIVTGNACCTVEFVVPEDAETALDKIVSALQNGRTSKSV